MSIPIYDCFDSYYKFPFGAVERTTELVFRLNIPIDHHITECSIVMFRPGFKEKFSSLENEGIKELNGERFYVFKGSYTPEHTGLHHYYFTLVGNCGRRYIKRQGASPVVKAAAGIHLSL